MNETNNVRVSISNHINKYLEESKCSKTEFGKKLGVSRTSVDRWIACVCSPDIELLPKLSEVINVSIPDLLGVETISANTLNPELTNLVKEYIASMSFKELVNRYMNDESFKKSIDYLVNIKN